MHIVRIIPASEKGFAGLLEVAATGDRIYLGTEQDLGDIHVATWGLGKRGPIVAVGNQLKYFNGSTIYVGLDEGEQWQPAGDGVVVRKPEGFYYIDENKGNRPICTIVNRRAWQVSQTGVLIDEGSDDELMLVEYGFDGSRKVHFISEKGSEDAAAASWAAHHTEGVLVDIGNHEGYKVAHVINNGNRVIVYDELKHGPVDEGSWYAHPIGIVGLRSGELRVSDEAGTRLLSKGDWGRCLVSTPTLPGVLYVARENYKDVYYFLVHKD